MNYYLVIPTLKGYEPALSLLKSSLPEEWKSRCIYVYQKEEVDSITQQIDGSIRITLQRNIYEYANWVGAQMALDADLVPKDTWFLFLHDTCKFRNGSKELLEAILDSYTSGPMDLVWLSLNGQGNICIIRRKGITHGSALYKDVVTMTKEDAIICEWKWLTQPHPLCPKLFPVQQCALEQPCELLGNKQIYSHHWRVVALLPSIQLEKYYYEIKKDESHIECP